MQKIEVDQVGLIVKRLPPGRLIEFGLDHDTILLASLDRQQFRSGHLAVVQLESRHPGHPFLWIGKVPQTSLFEIRPIGHPRQGNLDSAGRQSRFQKLMQRSDAVIHALRMQGRNHELCLANGTNEVGLFPVRKRPEPSHVGIRHDPANHPAAGDSDQNLERRVRGAASRTRLPQRCPSPSRGGQQPPQFVRRVLFDLRRAVLNRDANRARREHHLFANRYFMRQRNEMPQPHSFLIR